ncbi:MAG: glycerate kinase [Candidatus Bathyarchaeia archaeon]
MVSIKNLKSLVENAQTEADARARQTALTLLEAALSSVDPRTLVKSKVGLEGQWLVVGTLRLSLDSFDRVFVVGGGKASGAMAEALEGILGDRVYAGSVNIPEGTSREFKTRLIELNEARHPIPDARGLKGVRRILKLLEGLEKNDLVICLISGGGSALLPMPQTGISLEEKQSVTSLLLKCGATIDEVNVVRKHISGIKGGRLASLTYPASLLCLILSDVVGDPLTSIASGPTVPDPSTYSEAVEILRRYGIWDDVPGSVRRYLEDGLEGRNPESPKPGDRRLSTVHNIVIGSNRIALEAAEEKAKALGFNTLILSSFMEGEARHVGTVFAGIAREIAASDHPLSKPAVVLAGGETTVTVTGGGRGGRNQELVLSSSLRISGIRGVSVASIGSDGLDGPTDAAGAVADGSTVSRALGEGLEPVSYLGDNDSYSFFRGLGDLIYTGPTGTNVNDIMVIVNV